MDWPLVINRNRDALRRIIAALFALAGAASSGSTLPRHVHAAIMLVLRPAESALRRLIVIAARGLVLKPRAPQPFPAGLPAISDAGSMRAPAFSLFDPLKHFSLEDYDNSDGAAPRIGFFSFYGEDLRSPPSPVLSPEAPVDAASLMLRLRSLRGALSDLPKQARRLARWQARRDVALKRKGPFRPMRMSIFRPGFPPGYRKRQLHEVDDVLRECHYFALEPLERPNTS